MIISVRRPALTLAAVAAVLLASPGAATAATPPPAPSGTPASAGPVCIRTPAGDYSCSVETARGTVSVTAPSSCSGPEPAPLDLVGRVVQVVTCSSDARDAAATAAAALDSTGHPSR